MKSYRAPGWFRSRSQTRKNSLNEPNNTTTKIPQGLNTIKSLLGAIQVLLSRLPSSPLHSYISQPCYTVWKGRNISLHHLLLSVEFDEAGVDVVVATSDVPQENIHPRNASTTCHMKVPTSWLLAHMLWNTSWCTWITNPGKKLLAMQSGKRS